MVYAARLKKARPERRMAVLLFLGLQWFKAAMGLCQAEMRMNTFGKSSNLALAARPNINPLRLHGGIMNRRQISEPEQSSHEQTIRTDEEESTEKDMEATCKSSPRNTGQYLGQCMCSWRTLELRGGSSVDWGGTKYERGTRQVNDNLNGGDSAEVQQEAQEQRFTFVSSVAYFIFRLRIGWRRMLHSLESWAKLVGLGFLVVAVSTLWNILGHLWHFGRGAWKYYYKGRLAWSRGGLFGMLAWLQDEWEQQEMVNFDQFDHLHPDLQRERARAEESAEREPRAEGPRSRDRKSVV